MCKVLKCGKSIWDLAMNITIGLIGVVFVAYGGYFTAMSDGDNLSSYISTILEPSGDGNPLEAAEMVMVTLVGLFLIAAGCLGIVFLCCSKLRCLNMLLTISKVLVSATLIIIIILVAISMATASSGLKSKMTNEVRYLYNPTDTTDPDTVDLVNAWDGVQRELECCGSTNYTDWYRNIYDPQVPDSCCAYYNSTAILNLDQCRAEFNITSLSIQDSDYINTQGCYDGVRDFIMMRGTVIILLVLVIYGLQIADLIVSCICCPTKISPDD